MGEKLLHRGERSVRRCRPSTVLVSVESMCGTDDLDNLENKPLRGAIALNEISIIYAAILTFRLGNATLQGCYRSVDG